MYTHEGIIMAETVTLVGARVPKRSGKSINVKQAVPHEPNRAKKAIQITEWHHPLI
jgi:hypothetical protein